MTLLSPITFQPVHWTFVYLIPPSSAFQWLLRLLLLILTLTISWPILLLLVPISVYLHTHERYRRLAPLPLHPDNLPSQVSYALAVGRGLWVYLIGGMVWSITSTGAPPHTGERFSRIMAYLAKDVIERLCRFGDWLHPQHRQHHHYVEESGRLRIEEERIKPFPSELSIGVMTCWDDVSEKEKNKEINGLWLYNQFNSKRDTETPSTPTLDGNLSSNGEKKVVYLFFGGGGYVTGWPLVHPFIFSLARTFPAASSSTNFAHGGLPSHAIFGPDVRRSHSMELSFPIPVLDAAASYIHLRKKGYKANEIVLMGDSAGGGLVWSVMSYLVILENRNRGLGRRDGSGVMKLGIPGGMIMISPWLCLPPAPSKVYPDMIDDPQLLNAARSYLARFPILKHRPNAFGSDVDIWMKQASKGWNGIRHFVISLFNDPVNFKRHIDKDQGMQEKERRLLLSNETTRLPTGEELEKWLEAPIFDSLTSHHPFVSPIPANPEGKPYEFVTTILDHLARNKTRLLVQIGTGEWFYDPTMKFIEVSRICGVDTKLIEEKGGFHVEACLQVAELGGKGRRLVHGIVDWTNRFKEGEDES